MTGPTRGRTEPDREREMLLLIEAAGALLATPQSDVVLGRVMDAAADLVKADAYAVWRRNSSTHVWRAATSRGLSAEYEKLTSEGAQPPAGLLQSEPLAIEDVTTDDMLRHRAEHYAREGIRSLLVVPFKLADEVSGTIAFYHRSPHVFSDTEVRLASALANVTAGALRAAEAYERESELRSEAERAQERASFLAEAGAILTESLDYETTLRHVAASTVPKFADWCSVDLLDGSGQPRQVALAHEDPAKIELAREFRRKYPPQPADALMTAIQTGRPVLMNDITEELIRAAALTPEHTEDVLALGIESVIIAPLVTPAKAVGALTFVSAESRRRYTPSDLDFAQQLATRAAHAIENARLHGEIRGSEERLRLAQSAAGIGTWTWNLTDNSITWSPELYSILGVRNGDVSPSIETWASFIHPHDRDRIAADAHRAIEEVGGLETEFRIVRPDGQERWVLSRARVFRDDSGRPSQLLGINLDLTEQKRIERELRESEARFRQLADAVPAIVWVANAAGDVVYLNSRWYAVSGLTEEQSLGYAWTSAVHPEDVDRVSEAWQHALSTKTAYAAEVRFRVADGAYRWFMARALPVCDSEGNVLRWFGNATDVDEAKRTENDLRKANAELEEFAFVASHDLQEPLRMVNIFTQLALKNASQDARTQEYVHFVRQGVSRMEQLIGDLLSYSRVIHSDDVPTGSADLSAALSQALESLESRIRETDARIKVGPLPCVRGESSQLALVFQNLLTNAMKYCPEGVHPAIDISARAYGSHWIVSVRDNGIGFDQKYATQIFGLFKRLHKNEYPGTGLGLAICHRIIERYSGRMWAESAPGQGSTFYFALPKPS